MSRLQQHQKKQLIRSIIFYAAMLVALFIAIFTIGLKILLNASVFIAQLTSKNQPSTLNKNSDFIGTIDIDNIPTATNSSRIIVSGTILNFDLLQFFINGEKVKETNVTTADTFTEEIGDLKTGNNEVYIKAIAKEVKKEKQSKTYLVFYKTEKPKLEIKEPADGSKTSNSEVKIVGSTDKETYIRINDSPVVVDSQGNFQYSVRLHDGENKIKIVAQDVAGNQEEKTLTVTYQKD